MSPHSASVVEPVDRGADGMALLTADPHATKSRSRAGAAIMSTARFRGQASRPAYFLGTDDYEARRAAGAEAGLLQGLREDLSLELLDDFRSRGNIRNSHVNGTSGQDQAVASTTTSS